MEFLAVLFGIIIFLLGLFIISFIKNIKKSWVKHGLINYCIRGNLKKVKLSIDYGADIECTDIKGNTPLLIAAGNCHLDIVKYLLQKGASKSVINNEGLSIINLARFGSKIYNDTSVLDLFQQLNKETKEGEIKSDEMTTEDDEIILEEENSNSVDQKNKNQSSINSIKPIVIEDVGNYYLQSVCNWFANALNHAQMSNPQISNKSSFIQIQRIFESSDIKDIVITIMEYWKASVDQRTHIMGGIENSLNISLTVSCCPTKDIELARDKYIGMRYPYLIGHTMNQINYNILENGFVHIIFCMDEAMSQYNIDFFSIPSGTVALITELINKDSNSIILPRKDYFKNDDDKNFGKVFNEALIHFGII